MGRAHPTSDLRRSAPGPVRVVRASAWRRTPRSRAGARGIRQRKPPDDRDAHRGDVGADGWRRACARRGLRKRSARALRVATGSGARAWLSTSSPRQWTPPDATPSSTGWTTDSKRGSHHSLYLDHAFDVVVANIGRAAIVELRTRPRPARRTRRVARGERHLAVAVRPRQGLPAPARRDRPQNEGRMVRGRARYSMRRPLIALAMTRRWISEVPSKIV